MSWRTVVSVATLALAAAAPAQAAVVKCVNGMAGTIPCKNVDQMAFLPHTTWGGGPGNDIWGWTDPVTNKEWALVGTNRGTAFVDVTNPEVPVYVGFLPCPGCAPPVAGELHDGPGDTDPRCNPHERVVEAEDEAAGTLAPAGAAAGGGEQRHGDCSGNSQWRDIEVYADHAYIGSEESGHGLVVFDLRQLRTVATPPVIFSNTFRFTGVGQSHTITVNTQTGFVYVNGSRSATACGTLSPPQPANTGGPVVLNAAINPSVPTLAGCVTLDGYTHDSQCVIYNGPDLDYTGREICLNSNENELTLVDVTNKLSPSIIRKVSYPGVGYVHQGWLTNDQRWFLLDDELDENGTNNTRTLIFDLLNLDAIPAPRVHLHTTRAIDHNQYIWGNYSYQSNYTAGLRIMETRNVAQGQLDEVGFFDVSPTSDAASFSGTWANYPFFQSGTVVINTIDSTRGLFVVRPTLADVKLTLLPPAQPPAPGQAVPYQVTVLNQGPAAANAAMLNFSILGGAIQSVTTTRGSCSLLSNRCRFGVLPKDAPATVTFMVRPESLNWLFKAWSTATEVDTRPEDNALKAGTR